MSNNDKTPETNVHTITDVPEPKRDRLAFLKTPFAKGAAVGTTATVALYLLNRGSKEAGYTAALKDANEYGLDNVTDDKSTDD